jgi:hypothetical protein
MHLWMISMKVFMIYLLLIRHKKTLYKDSKEILLYVILFLVNLKVLNSISNICMT